MSKGSSTSQKPPSVSLGIVGDVRVMTDIALLKEEKRKRWLLSLSESVDYAIANLEAAVTRFGAPAEKLLAARSDPGLLIQLRDCGFNLFTLSNNHIMDYGSQGLADTLTTIDNIGLERVGAGLDWDEAVQPIIVKLPGKPQVSIVNFSCTLPSGSAAAPDRPGVAPIRVTQNHQVDPVFIQEQPGTAPWVETYIREQDERAVLSKISHCHCEGGIVIAIIHWGVPPHWQAPFQGYLATYQRPLARRLINAGAHAVVGHHPHVLHGVEIIEGSPVFYSLGNFLWHPNPNFVKPGDDPLIHEPGYKVHWRGALALSAADPRKRQSVFLKLTWYDHEWRADLTPAWINDDGEPLPASESQSEEIIENLIAMSRELGCSLSKEGGRVTLCGKSRQVL